MENPASVVVVGTPWWAPVLGVVVGVFLAFIVSAFQDWWQRRRRRIGFLEALALEVSLCAEIAKGYFESSVKAPAYRMPLLAYQKVLPELLSERILNSAETNALARFYLNAAAFNFALDQAQATLLKKKEDRATGLLEREVRRAKLKAKKLRKDADRPNFYDHSVEVLRRHLPRDSTSRLKLADEDLKEDEAAEET